MLANVKTELQIGFLKMMDLPLEKKRSKTFGKPLFPAGKQKVAQLFFTKLSQLVTFFFCLIKKCLRQACLEKGQLPES
jgi:hypothetical protein